MAQDELKDFEPYGARKVSNNFRASALRSIWLSVLMFTGWAALIVGLDITHDGFNLGISNTMLSVLGTVIGFIISYRTSSAYDRYWEGRRLWSDIVIQSRVFARLIWFHVPNYINLPADPNNVSEEETVKGLIEKKTMINVIEAFSFSLKHYLRSEPGVYYEDLWPLVCYLPRYNLPSGVPKDGADNLHAMAASSSSLNEKGGEISMSSSTNTMGQNYPVANLLRQKTESAAKMSAAHAHAMAQPPTVGGHGSGIPIPPEPLRPARNPPEFNWIDDLFQFLIPVRSAFKYISRRARSKDGQRRKGKKRKPLTQENIPLELTLVLSSYISTLAKRKTIDAPTVSAMLLSVSNFTTALASLERILTTPIPVGYAIHLKHVVWLYLLVLPFQIEATLKWVSIPAVAISAFVFLGLLSIGTEIENPFGYDLNDLNMDYFCQRIIHREMLEITSHPSESLSPDIFIYSTQNVPFHPQDNRNAEELLSVRNARNHVERALSSSTLDHIERTKTYNGRADGRDPIEAVAEA